MRAFVAGLAGLFISASLAQGATVLAPGSTWEYTFTNPTGSSTWNTTTGVGGIWSSGAAPFSNVGSGDFAAATVWPADGGDGDDLWLRTSIDLCHYDLSSIHWDLGVDNGFKLYANGTLVASANAEGFTFRWEYGGGFGAALVPGMNVIAVALEDHGGLTAFDMQITGDPSTVPCHTIPLPGAAWMVGALMSGLGMVRVARRK